MTRRTGSEVSVAFARAWRRKRIVEFIHSTGRLVLQFTSWTVVLVLLAALPVLVRLLGFQVPTLLLYVPVCLTALLAIVSTYNRGDARWDLERRIGIINGSLAGNVDSFARLVLKSPRRKLSEQETRGICESMLQCLRQYVELILENDDDVRVRATLAVPVLDEASEHVTHLRVWCYDEPYDDRRWSVIPMGLPGSPAAFASRSIEIISDLQSLDGIGDLKNRRFRSVLSIPVTAGGPAGDPVAVVSFDAAAVGYFDPDKADRIFPIVMPTIACIALVLLSLDDSAVYEFSL